MKYALSVALLLLMMPVLVLGQVESKVDIQKMSVPDGTTQLERETEGNVPTVLPLGDPTVGDTIAVTDYDYFSNSIIRDQIVEMGGMGYMANMIRGFDPGDDDLRNIRYIYNDGSAWVQIAPFGESNHTGWPQIDVTKTGSAPGTIGIVGHAGSKLAIWDGTNFIVSSEFDANTDPSLQFLGDVVYLATSGDRVEFEFYSTSDFGGSFTNWGSISDYAPPLRWIENGGVEVGMQKSPDETHIVMFGTSTGMVGGSAHVFDGVDPDSADNAWALLSTDAGTTWIGERWGADGDFTSVPGYPVNNFAPLFENFGQLDMAMGNDYVGHMIANGYGLTFNATGDTAIGNAFPVLYKRSSDTDWKSISDINADTMQSDLVQTVYPGNNFGQSYPGIAVSEDGKIVYATWTGPQRTGGMVDTAGGNGYYFTDLYHTFSTDYGETWADVTVLAGDKLISEQYGHPAQFLEKIDDQTYRAHVVYMADNDAGIAVFDEPGATRTDVPIIYRTFDIVLVGVEDDNQTPVNFALEQNYPNPFNPSTMINFSLPERTDVSLKVYDMLGREVAELINGVTEAGSHEVQFNASDLASGMYVYTIKAGEFTSSKKMLLLK